jgi:hypothetical protein
LDLPAGNSRCFEVLERREATGDASWEQIQICLTGPVWDDLFARVEINRPRWNNRLVNPVRSLCESELWQQEAKGAPLIETIP